MIYLASQSTVRVENNVTVEGNAQVDRTMDVTVNGERTVIHKNTAGSDTITVQDGVTTHTETSADGSKKTAPTVTPEQDPEATDQVKALEKIGVHETVVAQASPSSKMKTMSLFEYLFRKLFGMLYRKIKD